MLNWLIVLSIGTSLPKGDSRCVEASIAELQNRSEREIVFFASWCYQCKEHLLEAKPKESLLVATFDSKARAEGTLKGLKISKDIKCIWDKNEKISDFFGIDKLPWRMGRE